MVLLGQLLGRLETRVYEAIPVIICSLSIIPSLQASRTTLLPSLYLLPGSVCRKYQSMYNQCTKENINTEFVDYLHTGQKPIPDPRKIYWEYWLANQVRSLGVPTKIPRGPEWVLAQCVMCTWPVHLIGRTCTRLIYILHILLLMIHYSRLPDRTNFRDGPISKCAAVVEESGDDCHTCRGIKDAAFVATTVSRKWYWYWNWMSRQEV